MDKFYITTPIYYVNDKPHIGHAYSNIVADVIARFMRMADKEVIFSTGTDEHGSKIEKVATQLGLAPKDFVDTIVPKFESLSEILSISNNRFIRTTDATHKSTVIQIWNKLVASDMIYLGEYEGWYSVREEAFYDETELIEHNNVKLSPFGSPVEWVSEKSYFFALSKFQTKLIEFYQHNPDFIKPQSRYNEVKKFVASGLKDLSISRSKVSWGIPVPQNSLDSNHENQTIYVWLDALSNYLSAINYFAHDGNASFWPANVHLIGKDILRFHAVYWPAFLLAVDLPLPKCILTHGWWTNEGQKISKSLGNVIDPVELCTQFGSESIRYYLIREATLGADGDFSHDNLVDRINHDLANKLGNLVQRVLVFIYKNFNGSLEVSEEYIKSAYLNDKLLLACLETVEMVEKQMVKYEISKSLEKIFQLIELGNIYINDSAPWNILKEGLIKDAQEKIYVATETIRYIAALLQPFLPITAAKILKMLNINHSVKLAELNQQYALSNKINVISPEILFEKI